MTASDSLVLQMADMVEATVMVVLIDMAEVSLWFIYTNSPDFSACFVYLLICFDSCLLKKQITTEKGSEMMIATHMRTPRGTLIMSDGRIMIMTPDR